MNVDVCRARMPLCEATGCQRRILDAGRPAFLMTGGRVQLLCGACAEVFGLAYPNLGFAHGEVNGTHIIVSVLSLDGIREHVPQA